MPRSIRAITADHRRRYYGNISPRISGFPGCCGAGILSRLQASERETIIPVLERIPSSYNIARRSTEVSGNIFCSHSRNTRYHIPLSLDLAFAKVLSELVYNHKGIWHTIDKSRSTQGDTVMGTIVVRRFWTWLEEVDAPVEMPHGEARNGAGGAWLESRVILFNVTTMTDYLASVWWPKYVAYMQELEEMDVPRRATGRRDSRNAAAADFLSTNW